MKKISPFKFIKQITVILSVTISLFSFNKVSAQSLIEFVLLGSGVNCGLPVVIIPDSVYHDLGNTSVEIAIDEIDETIYDPSVFTDTYDLSNTSQFEYLGYVQFDSGDTTSRRHGYRLKYPLGYSMSPGKIALFNLFLLYNSEWAGWIGGFQKSCLQCPVAPSRIKAMLLYTNLPYSVFNDAAIPYSGYSEAYADLDNYQQQVVADLFNWSLETNGSVSDYEDMLDPLYAGEATIPVSLGGSLVHSCNCLPGMLDYFQFADSLLRTVPLNDEEAFFDASVAIQVPAMLYCFCGSNYYFDVSAHTDMYEVIAYPMKANFPTFDMQVQFDGASAYTALTYSYHRTSEIGLSYSGSGVFTYDTVNGWAEATAEALAGPVVNAGIDTAFCRGYSVSIGGSPIALGGASPYVYAWSPTNGLSSDTDENPVASPTVTTSYVIAASDSNGCMARDTAIVTIEGALAFAGHDITIQRGLSVVIGDNPAASGGTLPYTYEWSPVLYISSSNIANPVAIPTVTTTYTLSVTDSIGCIGADSLVITVIDSIITNTSVSSYINKPWSQQNGTPDTLSWSASAFDSNGNILITGNNSNGLVADLLLLKYDTDGSLLWQTTYSHSSGLSDYGVAVTTDNVNNIYVAGTTVTSLANGFDYVILKYSSGGSLIWTTLYNGSGNSYDVPAAMALDSLNQYLYVTGASYGDTTGLDYCTLKLDISGNIIWTKRYDYANQNDVAVALVVNGSSIAVSGGSSSTPTNWDFCTLEYDISGNLQSTVRDTTVANGFDQVTAMTRNHNDGSIYVTGKAKIGSSYDIQTVKFDNLFNEVWKVTYSNPDYDDIGNDIAVDASGRVYVCGNKGRDGNVSNGILLQYDNNGNQQFECEIYSSEPTLSARLQKMTLSVKDGKTYAYVSGSEDNSGRGNLLFAKYDTTGNILIERISEGGFDNGVIRGIQVLNDEDVYLSGVRDTSTWRTYKLVKYSIHSEENVPVTNTYGRPLYLSNEVIVKFRPDIVNKNFVDNPDQQFAYLDDIVPDSVNYAIGSKIYVDYPGNELKVYKIFRWMTYSDSLSITRLGDTIVMPKLWSTFILSLPNYFRGSEAIVMDSLNTLSVFSSDSIPGLIEYAELNGVMDLMDIPDDSYINGQGSLLNDGVHTNGHINLNPAWDIEHGRPYIKVGIVEEDAINFKHEDFGDGTFGGSVIEGGKDFSTEIEISNLTTFGAHATACAGIVGAIRDNNKGIAGIAGGDGNGGASLYSLSISANDFAGFANAIAFGAANTTGGQGYGLDIENNSYGASAFSQTVSNAVKSAYDNQCVFIASRGNIYHGDNNTPETQLNYPACLNFTWVINVGASANDGFTKTITDVPGEDNTYKSMYGGNVDFIAPGDFTIVLTTGIAGDRYGYFPDDNYTPFSGTSSASPHVAGVAALMMSRHNPVNGYPNNLDAADVAVLLAHHCEDKTGTWGPYTYSTGYDIYSGNGLINAGAVMQLIDMPHYWVQHNNVPISRTITQQTTNTKIVIPYSMFDLTAGAYFADRYSVALSYYDAFPSSVEIIDYWGRNLNATGISAANPISDNPYNGSTYSITLGSNTASVSSNTFCWYVKTDAAGRTINKWIPASPYQVKTEYSLHLYDPSATGVVDKTSTSFFTTYPNPTNDRIWLSFINNKASKTTIVLSDLYGREINRIEEPNLSVGSHLYNFDGRSLPAGIYFVKFNSNKSDVVKKLIISH